jgi:hypothetical protein
MLIVWTTIFAIEPQEVLGEYLNVNAGRAYYPFDRMANVMDRATYNPLLALCWSLDFNVNPMCSVIAQLDDSIPQMPGTRRIFKIYFIDELFLRNSNTVEACQEFERKVLPLAGNRQLQVYVYGDATGSARQRAAGAGADSDWAVIRQYFSNHPSVQLSFRYQTSNPLVKDRVAAVNAAFCNAQGDRRAFVHPRCQNLIRDLEQVVFKPGTALLDQITDRMLPHISDAAGYLIETEMPVTAGGIGYQPGYLA